MTPESPFAANLSPKGSELEYRLLFEENPEPMWVIDVASLRLLAVNAAACAEYGYTKEELLALTIADIRVRGGAAEAHDIARLASGGRLRFASEHRRKDGSKMEVDVTSMPISFNGRPALLVSNRDVTRERQARRELEASEERFRQMADSISQVFWMTDMEKSTMLYVSPAYERIWGRSCESLYQSPSAWLEAVEPEDRARVKAAIEKQSTGAYDEVYRIRRPDGLVRWIRDRAFPVREEDGRVRRVTGIAEDVTDQRVAESALMRSELWLETAQDLAQIGAWMSKLSGDSQVTWSRGVYRIMGLPAVRPLKADQFWELVHPSDRETLRATGAAALRDGGAFSTEYRIVRPDGETRWLRCAARAAGEPGVLVGVVQDITDSIRDAERLRATEAQLRHAQKMEAVGRLAGGVAHDFNNLLTAILGMAELSLKELPPEHQSARDLAEIRETALRAAGLTQQLLAFSRRQFVEAKVLDVNEAVAGLAKMLRRLIGEDVRLDVARSPVPALVRVDPSQLEQLLINLAVNSRDAMDAGGVLTISVDVVEADTALPESESLPAAGRRVRLRVADTGTGMSEEVLAHLFEPFFTTKEPGKGTGLGLATCYGIASQNGGSITCRSEAGAGTLFSIHFPLVEERPARPERASRAKSPRGTEAVLVVEDEARVRRLIVRTLTGLGYRTVEAEDGLAGLRAARADQDRRIRLVITDTVMPRLSGKGLADALAGERPDIEVLLTSGYTDDVIVRAGIERANLPFLRKPFTTQALALKVREVLDGSKLKRRLRNA